VKVAGSAGLTCVAVWILAGTVLAGCAARTPGTTTELVLRICAPTAASESSGCQKLRSSAQSAMDVQSSVVHAVEFRLSRLHGVESTVRSEGADEVVVLTTASADKVLPLLTTIGSIAFATAVPGTPYPGNPLVDGDQQGRLDPQQFDDPAFYPPGYHWKIDPRLHSGNVTSAYACTDQSGQWSVCISFDKAGAAEWSSITTAAYKAYVCNPALPAPESRVAIFVDRQVVSAPNVISGGQRQQTQITGNFKEASAALLAEQIGGGALPAEVSIVSINGRRASPAPTSIVPITPSSTAAPSFVCSTPSPSPPQERASSSPGPTPLP